MAQCGGKEMLIVTLRQGRPDLGHWVWTSGTVPLHSMTKFQMLICFCCCIIFCSRNTRHIVGNCNNRACNFVATFRACCKNGKMAVDDDRGMFPQNKGLFSRLLNNAAHVSLSLCTPHPRARSACLVFRPRCFS